MKKVFLALLSYLRPKYFIYRFTILDGSERGNDIDNTNVVGYRFINQGNTAVQINGMQILSAFQTNAAGIPIPGNDIDISTKVFPNEVDSTVYKYKFIPGLIPDDDINLLVVISKILAIKRPEQFTDI